MIIYHGSTVIVEEPRILQSKRFMDFGTGFYTTSNREQARRWASKVSTRLKVAQGYISRYEFDSEAAKRELSVIHFATANEEWLEFVSDCRNGRMAFDDYDIVIGPVADDNVYETVQLYELGVFSKKETIKRLKVQKLYDQILFHTEHALQYCSFMDADAIGGDDGE